MNVEEDKPFTKKNKIEKKLKIRAGFKRLSTKMEMLNFFNARNLELVP
jgi:hypothetical protein